MYAQISLVGRVTHDVELRARATTGEPYMQLGLAVNEGYKDHIHTSYYQCWLESEEATRASKAGVHKGSLLFVNGQLSVVDVPRKDGSTRTVARISRAHWDYIALAGQPGLSRELRRWLESNEALSRTSLPLLQGSDLQTGILAAVQPHTHTVGAVLLGRCEAARREVLADAAQLLARMIAAQLL